MPFYSICQCAYVLCRLSSFVTADRLLILQLGPTVTIVMLKKWFSWIIWKWILILMLRIRMLEISTSLKKWQNIFKTLFCVYYFFSFHQHVQVSCFYRTFCYFSSKEYTIYVIWFQGNVFCLMITIYVTFSFTFLCFSFFVTVPLWKLVTVDTTCMLLVGLTCVCVVLVACSDPVPLLLLLPDTGFQHSDLSVTTAYFPYLLKITITVLGIISTPL